MVFDTDKGTQQANVETCRDADDIFVDARRQRVYVSCGEGVIDVLALKGRYKRIAQVPTVAGARTSLFVAGMDRFYLGVRSSLVEPAAIWVFRPQP